MIYPTVRFNHLLVDIRYTTVMLHKTFRPDAYSTIKFKTTVKSGMIFSRALHSRKIKQAIYHYIYSLLIQLLEFPAGNTLYFTPPVDEFSNNVYFL